MATFNILHGEGASVDELAHACASLDADVLCLQEVDRGQARSGHADQTEAVARATGAAAWRFEPAVLGEPGGSWRPAPDGDDPGGAAYGVALVSRLPVTRWHTVRLPAAPMRSLVYVPTHKRFILLPDEPRIAVVAAVATPRGDVVVSSAHLSFVPGWNLWQLRRLVRDLVRLGAPTVLLGDLNVPGPAARLVTPGWRVLGTARTFPAPSPKLQIDHALGRGALPPVTGAQAKHLPVSDHRALVVDLAE